MRSKFRTVVLVLVGALALSGVAVASASAALPEIVNSKGGELVKKKFTSKASTAESERFLETKTQGLFKCTGFSGKGEVKGTRGGEETSTYTGCMYSPFGCNTAGSRAGEITFTTSVTPVYLNKAEQKVALLLSLKPGGLQFECASGLMKVTLSGAFLVHVGTVNKLKTTYNFETKQNEGIQELREYENEAGEKVKINLESEASGYKAWSKQPSAPETYWETTFEEEAEFKA